MAGIALFLGTVLLYAPAFGHEFVSYDDGTYVTQNEHVAEGLTLAGVRWAATSVEYACNWHPLTWVSHMLDVQLFGLGRPGGHHASSVVLLHSKFRPLQISYAILVVGMVCTLVVALVT